MAVVLVKALPALRPLMNPPPPPPMPRAPPSERCSSTTPTSAAAIMRCKISRTVVISSASRGRTLRRGARKLVFGGRRAPLYTTSALPTKPRMAAPARALRAGPAGGPCRRAMEPGAPHEPWSLEPPEPRRIRAHAQGERAGSVLAGRGELVGEGVCGRSRPAGLEGVVDLGLGLGLGFGRDCPGLRLGRRFCRSGRRPFSGGLLGRARPAGCRLFLFGGRAGRACGLGRALRGPLLLGVGVEGGGVLAVLGRAQGGGVGLYLLRQLDQRAALAAKQQLSVDLDQAPDVIDAVGGEVGFGPRSTLGHGGAGALLFELGLLALEFLATGLVERRRTRCGRTQQQCRDHCPRATPHHRAPRGLSDRGAGGGAAIGLFAGVGGHARPLEVIAP